MNTNISSLQTIVDALKNNDHVSAILPIKEGDKIVGYTISFANGGDITIKASDDGINASVNSYSYDVLIEINGGNITINMGQGDTDAVDSNGDLIIRGGNIDITAQFAFDYDRSVSFTGGTVYVNGSYLYS